MFGFVDKSVMGLLQEARLSVISRLGKLAQENDICHILVAGDVYDLEHPSQRLLNQPMERMRVFDNITWHLLPGNHDPQRPNGLWDRVRKAGVPDNIEIYSEPIPQHVDGLPMVILPAPLHHKRTLHDPTEYMNNVDLPEETIRVGLAHGSIAKFGTSAENVSNYIDPTRPETANLSYLALGDWHGQKKINSRCWYSGTPENDAFNVVNGGKALIVEINSPDALPNVTPIDTGKYTWVRLSHQLKDQEDIDLLERKIRSQSDELDCCLIRLTVEGALSLEDQDNFRNRVVDGVSAALCHLEVNQENLFSNPTKEDIDQIDVGGFVREAAVRLKELADNGGDSRSELAREALLRLYLELKKSEHEFS